MKKLLFFFLLSSSIAQGQNSPAAAPHTAGEVRYAFMTMGNRAGYEKSARNPDGSLQIHFEFNDRGRGPSIDEKIVSGKEGIPTAIEVRGVDYFKAPVEERFSLQAGKAIWKNRAETGEKSSAANAFYVSLNGAPEETALLVRALLASPGHKLALLPEGEAFVEKRGELQISANSKSRTVVQYAVGGLGFSPFPVWLDKDGAFFASVSPWSSLILEGWEAAIADLIKAQDKLENERSLP